MKEKEKESLKKTIKLLMISLLFFAVYYFIFHNVTDLINSIAEGIVSIPISIFFTTLVMESIIKKRETEKERKRVGTLSGVFFSEFGTELLNEFIISDDNCDDLRDRAQITSKWTDKNFFELKKFFEEHDYRIVGEKLNFKVLKKIIDGSKDFMIDILINPVALVGEEFTNIIFDTLHLREEIDDLEDVNNISKPELEHLECDIYRVYKGLSIQWITYMKTLNKFYPSLFLKALKKSPYNRCLTK